jgi:hypothetical protein
MQRIDMFCIMHCNVVVHKLDTIYNDGGLLLLVCVALNIHNTVDTF